MSHGSDVSGMVEDMRLRDYIPSQVTILVRDLITYRRKAWATADNLVTKEPIKKGGFSNLYFHNKGIEMIHLHFTQ